MNKKQSGETGPDQPHLSARECECLSLAAKGLSDRAIGEVLGLSAKTVGEYIERTKRKLDATSRTEAIVCAVKLGLLGS